MSIEEMEETEEKTGRGRSRRKKEEEPFSWKREIISWIQIIVAAVVIALVLNNFIIANSRVPTGSMAVSYTHLDVYKRQGRGCVRAA